MLQVGVSTSSTPEVWGVAAVGGTTTAPHVLFRVVFVFLICLFVFSRKMKLVEV